MNDEYYISIALKLASKAYEKGEVPVGALIVKNNVILSTAYNKKNSSNIAIKHAELIAIEKANKKINDWRLNGCTLYVSLKPCPMCMSAIMESRISRVVYCCDSSYEYSSNVVCTQVNNKKFVDEGSYLLKKFFQIRR